VGGGQEGARPRRPARLPQLLDSLPLPTPAVESKSAGTAGRPALALLSDRLRDVLVWEESKQSTDSKVK